MNLTIPKPVQSGDTVYIVSPSAGLLPFVKNRLKRAVEHLEALGLRVVIANHAANNAGYVSDSIEHRVADLHDAFNDDSCTLIMAAIGGNHANQLLPYIDFDLVKKHPKSFVGYSDNTVLHWAFATQANLQSFYGPCFLNQFGEYPEVLPYTLHSFINTIMTKSAKKKMVPSAEYTDEILDWFNDEDSSRQRILMPATGPEWWRHGAASGWALPGALPSLNHLLGTPYFPNPEGAILMIDIPEGHTMYEGLSIADVDAWMTDLDNTGVLQKIHGITICRPYRYTSGMLEELKKVITRITSKYTYPVVANLDFGHTDPMVTIPLGTTITLDSEANSIFL